MKYLFVDLGILQGEFTFNSLSVHEVKHDTNPDEFGRKYAQNFYCNNAPEDELKNGEYWYEGLVTYLNECREISSEEYRVLRDFL